MKPEAEDGKAWAGPTGGLLVALLTTLVALGPFSVSFYVPAMPSIAEVLQADPEGVQKTLTTFLLGFALAQLLIGPLSDRFGRRPILLIMLMFFIGASALCAFANSLGELLVLRFLQGVGACCGPVLGRSMVRDLFDGKAMVRVFSIIGTAVALGPAIAPAVGGAVYELFGWQMIFFALVAVAGALLVLVIFMLPESNRYKNPEALNPTRLWSIYQSLLSNGTYMGHVLLGGLIFGGVFSYHATASFLFIDELGLSPGLYGLIASSTVPAYAIGNFLSGRLSDHLSSRTLVTSGLAFCFIGAAVTELLSGELSIARLVFPMAVYFFGFGIILPHAISGALQPYPRVAGAASAILGATQMASGAAFSFLAAVLYAGSAEPFGWLVIGLSLAASVAYFGLTTLTRKDSTNRA